jgi:hypothetical protein
VHLPARRDLILGGFVAAVAVAHGLALSFAAPFLNFLIVLFALCAGGALVLALFGVRPRWLGIPLGLLGTGGVPCSSTGSCTTNAVPRSVQVRRPRRLPACSLPSRVAAPCLRHNTEVCTLLLMPSA